MRLPRNKKVIARILLLVGVTIAIPCIIAAPNSIRILKILKFRNNEWQKFLRSYKNLIRHGYLRERVVNGETYLTISKEGERLKQLIDIDNIKLKRQTKWDGKWRFVTFDISERFAGRRRMFQYHLMRIGMKKMQKSFYVYPYECRLAIETIVAFLKLENFVSYGTINSLDPEQHLLDYFDIKY